MMSRLSEAGAPKAHLRSHDCKPDERKVVARKHQQAITDLGQARLGSALLAHACDCTQTRARRAAAHIALYALLLAMPLSGWLMATTTPVRVPTFVFGLFELPYPLALALPTYRLAHAIHVASALALASSIVLHVAAALVHALLWRDRTLARMWRNGLSA